MCSLHLCIILLALHYAMSCLLFIKHYPLHFVTLYYNFIKCFLTSKNISKYTIKIFQFFTGKSYLVHYHVHVHVALNGHVELTAYTYIHACNKL